VKKILIIVLVVAIAAVFINDVGKFTRARYDLSKATDSIVEEMSQYALGKTRNASAVKAAELGRQQNVEVYQYDQDGEGVHVWTRVLVSGTWVIGPFMAWRAHKPLNTPFYVQQSGASVYQ